MYFSVSDNHWSQKLHTIRDGGCTSQISPALSLLDEDGKAVVRESRVAEAVVGVAGQVGGGWKNVIVGNVGIGGDRDWGGGGNCHGLHCGNLVDRSWGLQVGKTTGGSGLEGSGELGLGSSNILSILKEGIPNLLSLDVVVYWGKSSMFASNCCVKSRLELRLSSGHLGSVLERGSDGHGDNKCLQ